MVGGIYDGEFGNGILADESQQSLNSAGCSVWLVECNVEWYFILDGVLDGFVECGLVLSDYMLLWVCACVFDLVIHYIVAENKCLLIAYIYDHICNDNCFISWILIFGMNIV